MRLPAEALHDRGIPVVWVTLGERGSLLSTPDGHTELPALPTDVVDVTGAGDSMVAAFCHVVLDGGTPLEAARLGHAAAAVTITSHGMLYPQYVEMATTVERIILEGGAIPATIAVLDGRPRIGLGADDLELLATSADVTKVSVRDLPFVMSRDHHGATTVAATMRLAALAGISVFVTGGWAGSTAERRRRSTSAHISPNCRPPTSPSCRRA